MIFGYLDGLESAPCTPVSGKIGARWVTSETVQITLSFKNMDAHVASFAAWRRLARHVFRRVLPVSLDFRSEIDDAAAEHDASQSEANRQKKFAEHSRNMDTAITLQSVGCHKHVA